MTLFRSQHGLRILRNKQGVEFEIKTFEQVGPCFFVVEVGSFRCPYCVMLFVLQLWAELEVGEMSF